MAEMDGGSNSSRTRGPRLYHKKSRAGCIRCKQRRVKCDEARPSCGGCSRHIVACVYPGQAPSSSARSPAESHAGPAENRPHSASSALLPGGARQAGAAQGDSSMTLSPPNTEVGSTDRSPDSSHPGRDQDQAMEDGIEASPEPPESRYRRITELRLLHNYFTSVTVFADQAPELREVWDVYVPNLALKEGYDVILNGMLANSALNLWTSAASQQERDELLVVRQTYLGLALRGQRHEVSLLSPKNADALCFSSLRIVTHCMALMQTLPMDPWEPPLEFMALGRGAFAVFKAALDYADENNKINLFIRSLPIMQDTISGPHDSLDWLLEHPAGSTSPEALADRELDDEATQAVYDKTLSYICTVQRAVADGEVAYKILRRLGGFAFWVPHEFSAFLEERRPRALVVLAHFMALWIDYDAIWVIGKAGERQVRGIHKTLPLEWSSKLDGLFSKFKTAPASKPP